MQIEPAADGRPLDFILKAGDAARLLGVTVGTLHVWRRTGRYPQLRFMQRPGATANGRRYFYSKTDVERFIAGTAAQGPADAR